MIPWWDDAGRLSPSEPRTRGDDPEGALIVIKSVE